MKGSKKISLLWALCPILFISACNETSVSRISIENEELTKAISDSALMDVEMPGSNIELSGKVALTEGECLVTLKCPSGDTLFNTVSATEIDTIVQYKVVYSKKFAAPIRTSIKETFPRKLGRWTFYYEFKKVEETQPQGNYNFELFYED